MYKTITTTANHAGCHPFSLSLYPMKVDLLATNNKENSIELSHAREIERMDQKLTIVIIRCLLLTTVR
jgi:hypothetical protein